MSLFLAAAVAVSVAAPCARAQSTFQDVPDDHWAAQAVRKLAEAGILEGYPAAPAKPAAKKSAPKKSARAKGAGK